MYSRRIATNRANKDRTSQRTIYDVITDEKDETKKAAESAAESAFKKFSEVLSDSKKKKIIIKLIT